MDEQPSAPAPMMGESENNISAPTPAPTSEPTAAPAPDMHGFTSDQLAEMRKFYDANGGFDKVKSKISNPTPQQNYQSDAYRQGYQQFERQQYQEYQQRQQQQQPYTPPEGAITAQEFLAQQYFQELSHDPKYEGISEQISSGDVLKEMASFNIRPLNQDGSINDQMVRRYLDLKAQTIPAKGTGSEPNASAAPTVEYYQVAGDKVTNMDDAYKILQQDMQLKAAGQGQHPLIAQAEEFIKTGGKPAEKK